MRAAPIALALTCLVAIPARGDGPPLPLRVLYAGKGGTDRSREFQDFLRPRVAALGVADFAIFRDRDADGYDVAILDGDPADVDRATDPATKAGQPWPELSPASGRPTVLVGAMGGLVAQRHQLKLSWLCNCLDNVAHVLAPEHPIFRGPVAAELGVFGLPTPPRYRDWPGGATLGATIPSWTIQRTAWMGRPIEASTLTGLVLDPYGFADSPDCEAIAAGLNWKAWDSLAIARQGNFLFWGFAAAPGDMTPAGRAAFLNGLAYIRRFDGQRPLVRRTHAHRATWIKYAGDRRFIDDAATYATMMPAHLRRRLGTDYDGYPAFYRDHFEYLRPTGEAHVLDADPDAEALGTPNRRVESLDRWVAMLAAGDRPEVARRLLGRYTLESFDDARGWRDWLDRAGGRLYFSDTGGYKFRVAPDGTPRPLPAEDTPLDPDPRHPDAAEMATAPARARPGDEVVVTVRIRLAPGWHVAAPGEAGGPGAPTTLSLDLPAGVEPAGPWESPPVEVVAGRATRADSFACRRRLRIEPGAAPGGLTIGCHLRFQACDPVRCLPPTTFTLATRATVDPPSPPEAPAR